MFEVPYPHSHCFRRKPLSVTLAPAGVSDSSMSWDEACDYTHSGTMAQHTMKHIKRNEKYFLIALFLLLLPTSPPPKRKYYLWISISFSFYLYIVIRFIYFIVIIFRCSLQKSSCRSSHSCRDKTLFQMSRSLHRTETHNAKKSRTRHVIIHQIMSYRV